MKRLLLLLASALCLCGALASPASAAFGLEGLDVTFEEEDGTPTLLAGSHPFQMSTSFGLSTVETPEGRVPEGELRNVTISQIEGLVGSQTAVPTCSQADFNNRNEGRPACGDESAVGYAAIEAEYKVIPAGAGDNFFHVPVYSLDPPPGVAAQLGFIVLNVPVTIDVVVSPAPPYNLVATLKEIPQAVLLYRSKVVLWGNPASDAHNSLRGNCIGEVADTSAEPVSLGECDVDIEEKAFLTLPRACEGPLSTLFSALSWKEETATGVAQTHDAVEPQGIQGCEDLGLDANITSAPTTSQASSATGLDFGLHTEDEGLLDPAQRAQSDIEAVEVLLPKGMTINPSSANGLQACSFAQYQAEGLAWKPGVGCPEASKLGTVEVQSPLIDQVLEGDLFVASQDDNPFGTIFALYMVIRNERYGVLVKQAGLVEPDPVTGQLYSLFEDIPQLPFSDFNVRFRGGPRSPLVTPSTCGPKTTEAALYPISGAEPLIATSTFNVTTGPGGGPCLSGVPPFSPNLAGGTLNPTAGAYSPFTMRLTRADGEQEITRLDSVLPPGVVGKIAGLGRCTDAAIAAAATKSGRSELAAPSCPASSRIGTVKAGAGVGSVLTYVDGALYLAGPYAGAPLSVVAITPAVTGPFDLGTVAVREALDLDPKSAEVEVKGIGPQGAIPQVLEGVPLQLRDLRVEIDRPSFTLNATSCEPSALKATLFGTSATVSLATRYQASGCGALGFGPKLSLALKGGTERGDNPALLGAFAPRPGDANLEGLVVRLPRSAFLDQEHIRTICTRVQFAADACPGGAVYGTAKAWTPLLDEPLQGPVYLRSSENELPDLVFDLQGLVDIEASARIDSVRRSIRATFADLPDAPLSKVVVKMQGAKKGLIVNSRDLCAATSRAKAALAAHNGRRKVARPKVTASGCGKGRQGRRSGSR